MVKFKMPKDILLQVLLASQKQEFDLQAKWSEYMMFLSSETKLRNKGCDMVFIRLHPWIILLRLLHILYIYINILDIWYVYMLLPLMAHGSHFFSQLGSLDWATMPHDAPWQIVAAHLFPSQWPWLAELHQKSPAHVPSLAEMECLTIQSGTEYLHI